LEREPAKMQDFLQLLSEVASGAGGAGNSGSTTVSSEAEAVVDKNICCFSTGSLYTEAMLGVGVSRDRRNLSTAGEFLAKEAYDGGLRQNTNKAAFEFFLPVWINETHAARSEAWRSALQKTCLTIGAQVFEVREEDDAVLEVFPRLINQMIVEMMKPEAGKSEAIATFEALCNFWRTLRWLVDTKPSLRSRIAKLLTSFATEEACRHKDKSPDLGVVLVLYTVLQGYEGCPSRQAFINAYADENSVRWVMWWQRSGTRPESGPVFEATKVSREICMFQMMVVDLVIGDVPTTLRAMEATNCKLPERLEALQKEWRARKEATTTWTAYFGNIGATPPKSGTVGDWISACVRRAAEKGPKYGGAKGSGKGGVGGKGKSKGASKGYSQARSW